MWQYKTIITARVPRYQKDGKTISVEVTWAMPDARMSRLLEKNPFINAAKTYFPNTKHCHDMYHCVSSLNTAVDKVRRWETKTKPLLKKARYICLKDQVYYTD